MLQFFAYFCEVRGSKIRSGHTILFGVLSNNSFHSTPLRTPGPYWRYFPKQSTFALTALRSCVTDSRNWPGEVTRLWGMPAHAWINSDGRYVAY